MEPLQIPLNVCLLGERQVSLDADPILERLATVDLVISLGDIDLEAVAPFLQDKPALCVLGDRDPKARPSRPFHLLHCSGVIFKGWRLCGISGGLPSDPGSGMRLEEAEIEEALERLAPCDILISHIAPAGYEGYRGASSRALRRWIEKFRPAYAIHASDSEETIWEAAGGRTLVIGVHGILFPPGLIV